MHGTDSSMLCVTRFNDYFQSVTALMVASHHGFEGIVEYLLAAGASVNKSDKVDSNQER
jgi:ankyrin repeat protein